MFEVIATSFLYLTKIPKKRIAGLSYAETHKEKKKKLKRITKKIQK